MGPKGEKKIRLFPRLVKRFLLPPSILIFNALFALIDVSTALGCKNGMTGYIVINLEENFCIVVFSPKKYPLHADLFHLNASTMQTHFYSHAKGQRRRRRQNDKLSEQTSLRARNLPISRTHMHKCITYTVERVYIHSHK